jgi:hypothetical protein
MPGSRAVVVTAEVTLTLSVFPRRHHHRRILDTHERLLIAHQLVALPIEQSAKRRSTFSRTMMKRYAAQLHYLTESMRISKGIL